MTFLNTLAPRDRRLAGRLEGLGDVVVGFAMSQLVIQLPHLGHSIKASDAFQFVAYFGTFALLVINWLNFHRMMSTGFAPSRLDLGVAFVYLAFTSLLPYAMNNLFNAMSAPYNPQNPGENVDFRTAFTLYAGAFLFTLSTSAIIWWRNLRRGWYHFDDAERNAAWQS